MPRLFVSIVFGGRYQIWVVEELGTVSAVFHFEQLRFFLFEGIASCHVAITMGSLTIWISTVKRLRPQQRGRL